MRHHCLAIALLCPLQSGADELVVTGLSPGRHALAASRSGAIEISFDRALDTSTVAGSLHVFGRWSGPATGALSYSNGDTTAVFTPAEPFAAGEQVFINLGNTIAAADGCQIRSAGYAYQFWTAAASAGRVFTEVQALSARTGPGGTRIYGGLGSDLNDDGALDITLVNENSADVRILMNRADGTGMYDPVLQPVNNVDPVASPNEPADFDGDGRVDVCVAATSTGRVNILFGNGDGTFQSAVNASVGGGPHGLAVLDMDGDGDTDIATSNTATNDVALLINDGTGSFGPPTFIEGGGNGEYGLTAADMNNDGITDLVVGARSSQTIIVLLSNGDGTFAAQAPQAAGGLTWMLVCGDVNGDGNMDVTSANSHSGSGSILLGNGDGTLAAPVTLGGGSHIVATDLGDLDGDGDLDWVISDFGAGRWRIYENDGSGVFTLDQHFAAPSNPACAIILDTEDDGDLDLALLDEISDDILIMHNGEAPCGADWNGDGVLNTSDFVAYLNDYNAVLGGGGFTFNDPDLAPPFGTINTADFIAYLNLFAGGCL